MIRVFELFCKLNFIDFSAFDIFNQAMLTINIHEQICPFCKTAHPDWIKHAVYERYLISFENNHSVTYTILVTRYRCSSCGHTHAVLPEFIIPYQSYSFLFIITVMRAYFTKALTVEKICEKYDISISTLYSWKKLFLRHKKIWLGILNDSYTCPIYFLTSFTLEHRLKQLKLFFLTAGISFLQGASVMKTSNSIPTWYFHFFYFSFSHNIEVPSVSTACYDVCMEVVVLWKTLLTMILTVKP